MDDDTREELGRVVRAALARLVDALVEDVLALSDDEILAEAAEDGDDPQRFADEMRARFEQLVKEME